MPQNRTRSSLLKGTEPNRCRFEKVRTPKGRPSISNEVQRRREPRFPSSHLPPSLQSVRVLIQGEELVSKVIDASYRGFGFIVAKPLRFFIIGIRFVLYPIGETRAVYGRVVNSVAIDENTTRVGVELEEVGAYEQYRKTLESLINSHSQ